MSLLTKEQREIIERARVGIKCELTQWAPAADINDLLSIIDALQARAPKQYTEQELRENYENCLSAETGEDNTWNGWIECAKFLGALKAEP